MAPLTTGWMNNACGGTTASEMVEKQQQCCCVLNVFQEVKLSKKRISSLLRSRWSLLFHCSTSILFAHRHRARKCQHWRSGCAHCSHSVPQNEQEESRLWASTVMKAYNSYLTRLVSCATLQGQIGGNWNFLLISMPSKVWNRVLIPVFAWHG